MFQHSFLIRLPKNKCKNVTLGNENIKSQQVQQTHIELLSYQSIQNIVQRVTYFPAGVIYLS